MASLGIVEQFDVVEHIMFPLLNFMELEFYVQRIEDQRARAVKNTPKRLKDAIATLISGLNGDRSSLSTILEN